MSDFTRSRSKPILVDNSKPILVDNATQTEFLKRYLAGEGLSPLAREYGCSPAFLASLLKRHNVRSRSAIEQARLKASIHQHRDQIVERYQAGESIASICRDLKCHHSQVADLLTDNGIQIRQGVHRHGLKGTPVYAAWKNLSRSRGVGCCEGWLVCSSFFSDVGHRPEDTMKFARTDKFRVFACGKCQECLDKGWSRNGDWMDFQTANRSRRNRLIEYRGETKTLYAWAKQLGFSHTALARRLNVGWDLERAFTTPMDTAANQPGPRGVDGPFTIDMTGQKFGKLTVIKMAGYARKHRIQWLCSCECGRNTIVEGAALRSGNTKSCGCNVGVNFQRDPTRAMSGHPLEVTWKQMIRRCRKDADYAGRGIKVCRRWRESFWDFVEDMGLKPEGPVRYTLERVDNDAGYSCGKCQECQENGWKSNCVWADSQTQSRNKRNTNAYCVASVDNVERTVSEWGRIVGISRTTIQKRLSQGWSIEDAVLTPVSKHKT